MSNPIAIAHYTLTSKLGEGGMGEVYRATDTKLDREVDIKILPAALANDPERLARFKREAKVLASLNHPNIATIFGVEEGALVMELIEGDTLVDSIAKDPSRLRRRCESPIRLRTRGVCAPARRHPPRSQAGQRQGRKPGEGAGFRPGQGE